MRLDKNKIAEFDEPVKIVRDDEEPKAPAKTENDSDNDEYEYVDIKEATSGIVSSLRNFLSEYYVVVFCAVIAIVAMIIITISRTVSTVFIALAFGILAALAAIVIYITWKDKKEAEEAYRHAVEVMEPVKRKMKEQAEEESSDN